MFVHTIIQQAVVVEIVTVATSLMTHKMIGAIVVFGLASESVLANPTHAEI
jgi:hypothetical protein